MRRIPILLGIVVTILALGSVQSANATPITFGNVASGQANAFPFSGIYQNGFGGTRYQQVYEGDVFGVGEFVLNSISFYGANSTAGGNANGTYMMSLSTTSSAVNGLSTNFATNVGADSQVFFSATLPPYPGAGLMTFVLPTAFHFNPANGNLLLDAQISGVSNSSTAFYVSQNATFGAMSSRMVNGTAAGTTSFGLVTSFDATPAATPVPEPSTFALLGGGLIAAVRQRRRKHGV